MQAVRIHAHGGPEVLQVEDIPRPSPGPGEVLARVLAISLNHLDLFVRRGMPGVSVPMPRIPGCDGTGEIVALGAGVEGLQPGQKVVLEPGFTTRDSEHVRAGMDHLAPDYGLRGEHSDGYACEYVTLPARYALPLPAGLDPVRTAAVPLVFLTAHAMVVLRAAVRPGERVLVLAGTSGVGSAAIQIACAQGARVIATAGSESKRALCLELGAGAAIDHSRPGWDREVKEAAGGPVDVVVEHVGAATWDLSMRCLARNGRLVTCGATTGPKVGLLLPHVYIKNLSVLGSTMGPRNALPGILARVAEGTYRPLVDAVLPLSRVREAHERLERHAAAGKIVLVPGG